MSTIVNEHFNRAAELYRDGRSDDAIKELKRAIDQDPGDARAYLTLAALFEALKEYEKAVDLYRKVLQIDIDDPRANLRLGIVLTHLHRYGDALTPLRMAWSNDRRNPRAANALARALDESGDYDTAQIMYEEALKLDPDLSDARFNLGTLRFNAHKFESAITQFMTYIIKVGDNSGAHRNIGKALVQLGQLDSAIKSFNKAAHLDEADATIYYNLGLVYSIQHDSSAAFDNYRHALDINPNYIEARYTLAKALKGQGQIEEAIAEFQIILEQSPEYHRALNGLANCYIYLHDYDSAIELLRQAITVVPEFALAHYNLGLALRHKGYAEEALHHFQEAARIDPSDQLAYQAAGQTRSQRIENQSHMVSSNLSYRLTGAESGA